MRSRCIATAVLAILMVSTTAHVGVAAGAGEGLFQQRCSACHSIGGGRLVGPDLKGVNDRRSEEWLLKFIKSSQAVISSGDAAAKALFAEYKMVMPDQDLSNDQIKEILVYLREKGGGGKVPTSAAPTKALVTSRPESSPEEIARGRNLFQGRLRFVNGGPSCISCHNTNATTGISGGSLAADLTAVYAKMGASGIEAVLKSPPFPVMKAAFEGHPLHDDEINDMIGFLQFADKENKLRQPREYGWVMLGAGLGGVGVLLGFYSLMWRRRKKGSVNQDIYDRQIKSE